MAGINVHLYPSPLTHEARMERICRFVSSQGLFDRVVMTGVSTPERGVTEQLGSIEAVRLPRNGFGPALLRKITHTLSWMRAVWIYWADQPVRCINAHSVAVLPLAVLMKRRHHAPLIYDTHELETESGGSRGAKRLIYKVIERALIQQCDVVSVVSDSIAEWYARAYRIPRPMVVRNIPDRPGVLPTAKPRLWRDKFGIEDEELIFLYQGLLSPGRRIERLIRVFSRARPDRHLIIMGYGPLETLVGEAAAKHQNIHYAPAVPPAEVLSYTACADIGLVGVERACLSYYYSLPNKLFEFLFSGLAVMAPDFPEIRAIVAAHGCGWILRDSDEDWEALVNSLDFEKVKEARRRVPTAVKNYSWKKEQVTLGEIYARLLLRSSQLVGSCVC
jgi:glycosyltransferase involved in cell wall biosynthesis